VPIRKCHTFRVYEVASPIGASSMGKVFAFVKFEELKLCAPTKLRLGKPKMREEFE
jgi:hypothetical protein